MGILGDIQTKMRGIRLRRGTRAAEAAERKAHFAKMSRQNVERELKAEKEVVSLKEARRELSDTRKDVPFYLRAGLKKGVDHVRKTSRYYEPDTTTGKKRKKKRRESLVKRAETIAGDSPRYYDPGESERVSKVVSGDGERVRKAIYGR